MDRWTTAFQRELGRELREAFEESDYFEISLNPNGTVFASRHSSATPLLILQAFPAAQACALLSTIAAGFGTVITESQPSVSGRLANGWRVQGLIPPLVTAPAFSLRRPPAKILTLADYLAGGAFDPAKANAVRPSSQAPTATLPLSPPELLRAALAWRLNMLVSGGTGTGKTTFINMLLEEAARLCPNDRVVTLEDTPELSLSFRNVVPLYTTPEITLRHLLRITLRLLPTRIIVGEMRGAEALDFLKSSMTGHPGSLATIHANSSSEALERLDSLIGESGVPSQMSTIARVIHLLVHLRGQSSQDRCVEEILAVEGFAAGRPLTRRLFPEASS